MQLLNSQNILAAIFVNVWLDSAVNIHKISRPHSIPQSLRPWPPPEAAMGIANVPRYATSNGHPAHK